MRIMALPFLMVTVLVLGVMAAQPLDGTDKGHEKKGPPPRGGFGGPPGPFAPGWLLPPPIRDHLQLTAEQDKQLDALENDTRDRLLKILTEAQRRRLQDFRPPPPDGPPFGAPGRPGEPERPPPPPPDERSIESTPAGIQWFATWDSGLREAKRSGRPILLVSAAASCAGVSGIW